MFRKSFIKFSNYRHAAPKIVIFLLAAVSFSCASLTESFSGEPENEARKAENTAVLSQARADIEKFRKGAATIKIVDAKNRPITGATVIIRQLSHDFKFGCYLKIDDLAPEKLPAYERRFARLFNFAVVGTYWDFVENKAGEENWTWFEREIAVAAKMNVRVEAAPVLWGTNESGTPKWLPTEKDELNRKLKKRVEAVLTRYGNDAQDWEIVNESRAPVTDVFAGQSNGEYVAEAFRTARRAAPQARLMINEYGVFGSAAKHNYNRKKYFDQVRELLDQKVPIDVVGIQAHANGEWFEPANVASELERYAALGKPLQITELSQQLYDYDDRKTPLKIAGNYRAGLWNDQRQAEFYREFYTVAFANRSVEAITTWGLDDARAWLPGIGLIAADGAPKAVYQTLDELINREWKTDISGASDSAGVYEWRGFYGEYKIEIVAPKRHEQTFNFALQKNAANDWTIKLRD